MDFEYDNSIYKRNFAITISTEIVCFIFIVLLINYFEITNSWVVFSIYTISILVISFDLFSFYKECKSPSNFRISFDSDNLIVESEKKLVIPYRSLKIGNIVYKKSNAYSIEIFEGRNSFEIKGFRDMNTLLRMLKEKAKSIEG